MVVNALAVAGLLQVEVWLWCGCFRDVVVGMGVSAVGMEAWKGV